MTTQPTAGRRQTKSPAIVMTGGGRLLVESLDYQLQARTTYPTVTALLPDDVLRQIAQRPVPLVICDDTAPSMRDFQLMGEIKALSPQTRVILIVPSGSPDQERRARAAGADAYLPHTFALRRLPSILDDLLA
jgi:DNA-binding NarL/FixJ family response regulator